jgi:hypothetical protein
MGQVAGLRNLQMTDSVSLIEILFCAIFCPAAVLAAQFGKRQARYRARTTALMEQGGRCVD